MSDLNSAYHEGKKIMRGKKNSFRRTHLQVELLESRTARLPVTTVSEVLCAILVMLLAGWSAAAAAVEPREIYRQTARGTALVRVKAGEKSRSGTAWVVNRERRLLITNHHVVDEASRVQVLLPMIRGGRVLGDRDFYTQGMAVPARVLTSNPRCDLAILQLAKLPEEVLELKLAADSPEPGERLHSVGNSGVSSAYWVYCQASVRQLTHRRLVFAKQVVDTLLVEVQAPINPGDSGSPLVNDRGEVAAVVSANNPGAPMLGLAIDVTRVRSFLEESRLSGQRK